jgi:hypothetical protein
MFQDHFLNLVRKRSFALRGRGVYRRDLPIATIMINSSTDITMKTRLVQHYVPKPVDLDRLTTPYTPDFFKEHGAILYQFLPTVKGGELLPGEVKYGYKFYLMDDPSKEGAFYLSSHKDMDTLKSRSKFLSRVAEEILRLA